MSTPAQMSSISTTRGRPVLLLGIALVLITGGLFLYGSVLTSVSYEVELEPSTLYTGDAERTTLTLHGVNRLGGRVPFSAPRFRCAVEEGKSLVDIEAAEDSTRYILQTRGEAGTVVLYCYTKEWPFPMIATLRIIAPLAHSVLHQRSDA